MFSGISAVPQPKSNTASVEKSETKVSADIPKDQRTHKIRIMKINIFSFLSNNTRQWANVQGISSLSGKQIAPF